MNKKTKFIGLSLFSSAGVAELNLHPYIDFKIANELLNYRLFKKYELIMSSSLSDKEKENLISYIDRLKNALKGGFENDKTNI